MAGEGWTSTGGPNRPEEEEVRMQHLEDWNQHGSFVSEELRVVADGIFNHIGANPAYLENISKEKKLEFVRLLQAYKDLPREAPLQARKAIQAEIKKLFR